MALTRLYNRLKISVGGAGLDKKFALVSLGCPKNLVDSEIMTGIMKNAGFIPVKDTNNADIIIVNTCSFIDEAKTESIDTILEMAEYKKRKCRALIVCGCLPEMYRNDVMREIPEVDAVLGTGSVADIAKAATRIIKGERVSLFGKHGDLSYLDLDRCVSTGPSYAYLKIAEGCDNRCSYCVIPRLRGPFKSRRIENVAREAARLCGQGINELIIAAHDTTRYGKDIFGEATLSDLIETLCRIKGLEWIRLLYCYPDDINREFVRRIYSMEKVVNYIDMPLQHSEKDVLKRMRRKGNAGEYLDKIGMLRSMVPDIMIRTSLIVGLPGESEEDFENLCRFVEKARFDRLGVFTYSREEGTPAAQMKNQIDKDTKERRRKILMEMQQDISRQKNSQRIGRTYKTIVEGVADDGMFYFGRTYGESPEIDPVVYLAAPGEITPGRFVEAKIIHSHEYDLIGDVVNEFTK